MSFPASPQWYVYCQEYTAACSQIFGNVLSELCWSYQVCISEWWKHCVTCCSGSSTASVPSCSHAQSEDNIRAWSPCHHTWHSPGLKTYINIYISLILKQGMIIYDRTRRRWWNITKYNTSIVHIWVLELCATSTPLQFTTLVPLIYCTYLTAKTHDELIKYDALF